MKTTFLRAIALAATLLLPALARAAPPAVVALAFPHYDLVSHVLGDRAQASMLLRPGTSIHGYEPTPADIRGLRKADLIVCTGGESDEWIDELLSSVGAADRVVRLLDLVTPLPEEHPLGMEDAGHEGHDHGHEGHDHGHQAHDHGHADHDEELDEHVWMSLRNDHAIVDALAKRLSSLDPEGAATYAANARRYAEALDDLDRRFSALIKSAPRHSVIVGDRFPFLYFVRDYGLTYHAAFPGCADETEASAKTIAFLIDRARETQARTIFTTEFSSDRIARAIAEGSGTKVGVLHSCHNVTPEQLRSGVSIVSLMEQNLQALEAELR